MKSDELKTFIEEAIFSEVKNTILNESKKEKKEVYHIMCDGKPLASFENKKDAEIALPKYKKDNKGKKLIIEKVIYESYADMIEALDKMSEELEEKDMKTENMNESISQENAMKLKDLCVKLGERKIAAKLVDKYLIKFSGIDSSELPDSTTYADGLDEIETLLQDEDWDTAIRVAKDTASTMLHDEGLADLDEETDTMEGNEFTSALAKAREEGKDKFTVDGKEYDVKESWGKMEEENENIEIDDIEEAVKGMCSECGKMLTEEGTMCSECMSIKEHKVTTKIKLKESQLRRVVKSLISEAMKGQPGTPGIVGKTMAKRVGDVTGKEAKLHLKDVEKKMKNYLSFDGNTNPEFPHQIGGERMAIHPSKEQADEIAKNKAGLQNLDYDMEPSENFKKRLEAALMGDSKMGNSAETGKNSVETSNGAKAVDAKEKSGNTIPSKTDKILKKQIKDRQEDKDERTLYDRAAVPTKNISESVNSEVDKMKQLLEYNKRTQ